MNRCITALLIGNIDKGFSTNKYALRIGLNFPATTTVGLLLLIIPSTCKHAQESQILARFHCFLFPSILFILLRRWWCSSSVGTLRNSAVGRGLDLSAVVVVSILFRASATHDGGEIGLQFCGVG
jgi:hypothetical protein